MATYNYLSENKNKAYVKLFLDSLYYELLYANKINIIRLLKFYDWDSNLSIINKLESSNYIKFEIDEVTHYNSNETYYELKTFINEIPHIINVYFNSLNEHLFIIYFPLIIKVIKNNVNFDAFNGYYGIVFHNKILSFIEKGQIHPTVQFQITDYNKKYIIEELEKTYSKFMSFTFSPDRLKVIAKKELEIEKQKYLKI